MEIISKINPLYQDLLKQSFEEYVVTTDCQRLCNQLEINNYWTNAWNEENEQSKDEFSSFFPEISKSGLLARFLNKLFDSGLEKFSIVISELLKGFLSWTKDIPNIEDILKDLRSINIQQQILSNIETEWQRLDRDILRKAIILKNITTIKATGGHVDNEKYVRLRNSLMENQLIAGKMPACIHKSRSIDDFWTFIKTARSSYQARREFINDSFTSLLTHLEQSNSLTIKTEVISERYIMEVWNKALARLNNDPEGAITAARTLIETVCKYILDNNGAVYDDSADLPKLYKLTASQLKLSPDQHTEQIFKQILGGCSSVVDGLASLRNKLSDAHGRTKKAVKPSARHATLAVNLSGALCSFLLQTQQAGGTKNIE